MQSNIPCTCEMVMLAMLCRECIGVLLQAGAGSASHLVCPLCRAKVQGQELVKGVNEGAGALQEEDSYTAKLEQQASTSESKLTALLEEVRLHVSEPYSALLQRRYSSLTMYQSPIMRLESIWTWTDLSASEPLQPCSCRRHRQPQVLLHRRS